MTIWKVSRVYSTSEPLDAATLRQWMTHPVGTEKWIITSNIEDVTGRVTMEFSDTLLRGNRRAAEELARKQRDKLLGTAPPGSV